MLILGIETSCDETAAAVVRSGRTVLSSVIYSQVARHAAYGGVVPEIASRAHVEVLPGIVARALDEAGVQAGELEGIAATRGPGLATCLLVGFTAAKALALRLGLPLFGINHLDAHVHSVLIPAVDGKPEVAADFPMLVLTVSGGHTSLVRLEAPGRCRAIGETHDDAAGEALDKGAKLLGLGYPGGPILEKTAAGGNVGAIAFPRGSSPEGHYGFSFSGLKTALRYHLQRTPLDDNPATLADVAASYQEAVVDALINRAEKALRHGDYRGLGCAGGVARNKRLRDKLATLADRHRVPLHLAAPEYCTDNAAMIAALAGLLPDQAPYRAEARDVDPTWPLGTVD